jgi:hypothetical protein
MTAFFIPGIADHAPLVQATYLEMRKQIEERMGRMPRSNRILELWTRRGNLDCVTTVGQPDPICGDTVLAIFDMGPHQPFVVCHRHGDGPLDNRCEVLDGNAYAVSEFDS